ncbi:MAG: PAS domain-containing sensor histidine kinase [Alphaproteobacteria bacterium]|nr:PAS domain-containing sensor histidine kinase [Alphaproteobacteria bacterium]
MKGFEHYNRLLMRLGLWARKVSLSRKLSYFLAVLALISGVATYIAFSLPNGPDTKTVISLLYTDLILLLFLMFMIVRRVLKVWSEKRQGSVGSGLHVRFVLLFLVITATPTLLVSIFSAIFFSVGLQAWFSDQVYNAVKESRSVAEAYLDEHTRSITSDAASILYDINFLNSPTDDLERKLTGKLIARGLDEAIIFDRSGQVTAHAGYTFALRSEEVPFGALDRADKGDIVIVTAEKKDRVRALAKIPDSLSYLYVGRMVDPSVLNHIERASIAVDKYESLEGQRSVIEMVFISIFIIVSLLLMLVSAWIGLVFASRISTPIVNLIDASDKIRQGDFSVRVREDGYKDELSLLSRAFNRMMGEISRTNKELDERRGFIETILAGVSVGVVSTDTKGKIRIINQAALDILGDAFNNNKGKKLTAIIPELSEALDLIKQHPDKTVELELKLYNQGALRILLARIVAEYNGKDLEGFIFTFDDITDLQSAQRKAAWADVARRVAHEIKNPLTPIQLAAERLKRKYSSAIGEGAEDFSVCTDTIVRHVDEIGRMVDEFSAFARMPAPVMKQNNIKNLLNQAVFLQKTANGDIEFTLSLPAGPVLLNCDSQQVSQVITNILKNSVEAIKDKGELKGQIDISLEQDTFGDITLSISDNGKGLPHDDTRNMITEPYITTKSKGTGLGLAIVKKIMEDHGGSLQIEDAPKGGAVVTLFFPHKDK